MTGGGSADRRDGGTVTLAFDVAALEKFVDPRAVIDDARRWSRYVGVIGTDVRAVTTYVARHGLQQDFDQGRLDRRSVLSKLRWEAQTPRYVFVGTTAKDRALAEHVGWEFLTAREAAEKADWELAADAGLLTRARVRLRDSISNGRLWSLF